jgi:hypothetical protein
MVLAVTPVKPRVMLPMRPIPAAILVLAAVPVWIAIVVARKKHPMTIALTVSLPMSVSVPIMVFITIVVPNEIEKAMELNFHIAGFDHGGHGHARCHERCQCKPRNQVSYTHNGPPV